MLWDKAPMIIRFRFDEDVRGRQYIVKDRESALRTLGQIVNSVAPHNAPQGARVVYLDMPPRWWPWGNCRPAYRVTIMDHDEKWLMRRHWWLWVFCGEVSG